MNSKTPCFNKDVEFGALSALINEPNLIFDSDLQENDFYLGEHKSIFKVIEDLKGTKIDTTLLVQKLKELKIENPTSKSAKIVGSYFTNRQVKEYFKITKEDSIKRQLNIASLSINNLVDEDLDINELLARSQREIMKINTLEKEDPTGKQIVKDITKAQEEFTTKYQSGGKYIGVETGIEKLDKAIDGMRKGHVWIIGAWANTGKSSFLLNIINNIMGETPVSLISLEMNKVDIGSKLIGIRNKTTQQSVYKSFLDKGNLEKVEEGKDVLYNSKLRVYTESFYLDEIKMLIRKDVYSNKTRIVAVDYAQNILGSGQKEYQLMTDIAQELQALARELKITILILSQISNESAKGGGAGAGFKGSGAFEAVADLAIRLVRDRKSEPADAEEVPIGIELAKNRHGFTGVIDGYYLHLKSGQLNYIDINKHIN